MIIDTVEEKQRNYTRREVEAAENARRLYVIVGRPSKRTFENMLKNGMLMNNPITVKDCKNALNIYCEDLGVLKRKTVQKKQSCQDRVGCDTKSKANT